MICTLDMLNELLIKKIPGLTKEKEKETEGEEEPSSKAPKAKAKGKEKRKKPRRKKGSDGTFIIPFHLCCATASVIRFAFPVIFSKGPQCDSETKIILVTQSSNPGRDICSLWGH